MATKKLDDEQLNQMLKTDSFTSEEAALLAYAFLPADSGVESLRPKAYVVLSAICQEHRRREGTRNDPNLATQLLVRMFSPTVDKLFAETEGRSLLAGACFLTALFQVDSLAASAIFIKDGLLESVIDSVDLFPTSLLSQEIARLLGQACGHKQCRGIVTPQVVRWLEFKSLQTTDLILQSAASVALIKLSKGAVSDSAEGEALEVGSIEMDTLAKSLTETITLGKGSSCVEAVEGLAYLTIEPTIKDTLARNPSFLQQLFALVPTKKVVTLKWETNAALIYGVSVIICNLTSFRPHLTEEEKQVEKLKRMTTQGKGVPADEDKANALADSDEHVKARIRLLLSCGVLAVFSAAIAATDSKGVRVNVGKSLLCMVQEKENRGTVLQAGGAKILQIIIKQSPIWETRNIRDMKEFDPSELLPIQALAKLSITSSPIQVFGPNTGAIYDAIRPLSILLQHPSSNLLQRFEAIMALTNLASHSPDVATRISKAEGVVDKTELLLLDDHNLVRRASMELICNLIIGSEVAFHRFSDQQQASKIHILLALSDVDDLPTRLAASGALAALSEAPSTCKILIDLQFGSHRFFPIMKQLVDPSPLSDVQKKEQGTEGHVGLVIRGVLCVANVFKSIKLREIREQISKEGSESGLLQALTQIAKGEGASKDPSAIHQAAEALSALAAD